MLPVLTRRNSHRKVTAGGGASNTFLTNLLAYYKCDEASGNLLDATANARDFTDNATVGATTGALSGARLFNGSSQYFSRTSQYLNGKSTLSISAWVYNTRGGLLFQTDTILYSDDGGDALSLAINSGPVVLRKVVGFSAASATSNSDLPLNASTHIVGTVASGGTMILYINGVAQTSTGSKSGSLSLTAGQFYIGRASSAGFWTGWLDEIGVWDRELSSSEVTTLYNSGTPLAYSSFN